MENKLNQVLVLSLLSLMLVPSIFLVFILGIDPWLLVLIMLVSSVLPVYGIVRVVMIKKRNPVTRLKKALPRCGFSVDDERWNDERTCWKVSGKFNDEPFILEVMPSCNSIDIVNIWSKISATDPNTNRLVEAVNDANCSRIAPRLILSNPADDGSRRLMTVYASVLPGYNLNEFLTATFKSMLSAQPLLKHEFDNPKPWNSPVSKHEPIGFTANN